MAACLYSCFLENLVHMIFLLENKQKTHANHQLQKVFAAVSVSELGKSLLMKQESRQKLFSGTLVES